MICDGSVELAPEPAALVGSGKAEGESPGTVVGDDLVAREVVVLDEHDTSHGCSARRQVVALATLVVSPAGVR